MTSVCVASRMAPEGAGRPKPLDKLFCLSSKKGSFLEPLAKYCLKRLPMLYYEGCRLNGLGSPSGIPAKIWGGEWKGKQGTRKKPREISLRAREQS